VPSGNDSDYHMYTNFAGQKFRQALLKLVEKFFRQCSNGHISSMYRIKNSMIKCSPMRAGGENFYVYDVII
jgi:hypothetical protein